ncbi:hypothetical protein [Pseudomonas koreensis]
MKLQEFKQLIRSQTPRAIAEDFILKSSIHAFASAKDYSDYLDIIKQDHKNALRVAIVGSANWKFSLNPRNNLSEFSASSDIDIAIICADHYLQTWDELRSYHRNQYYSLGVDARNALRRNGENVYSGFVSPKWVPSLSSSIRKRYEKITNKYSDISVGYRTVNMMYFRNMDETIDYYVRGIRAAKI